LLEILVKVEIEKTATSKLATEVEI